MQHYGCEPPWRGYSRWYGEWIKGPAIFEGGYVWTWLSPENPGSFLGQLSKVLQEVYLDSLRDAFSPPAYGLKEHMERVQ